MVRFCLKLAGMPIEVSAAFESTRDFCREYLTDETPLFAVEVTERDIEKMRAQDVKTAIAEGRSPGEPSDRYLETLALCSVILSELIHRDVLLFHGSVLAVSGRAYMFTAKSGTGKTTHSRLWLKNYPDCHILNGDKPLLLFKDGQVFACGSPWQGKERYGMNEMLPLEAICILERDSVNHIDDISLREGLDTVLRQCHVPEGSESIILALRLLKKLSPVKLYRLGCNMDDEAAAVSYGAMVR